MSEPAAKKKRAAEVQLNKDDFEAGKHEVSDSVETGDWQKSHMASAEELASRKILKVKRKGRPEPQAVAAAPALKPSQTMSETVKEASAILGDGQLGSTRSQTHNLAGTSATGGSSNTKSDDNKTHDDHHKADAHKPELKTSHTMAETVKEASAVLGDNQLGSTRSQTHNIATGAATSTPTKHAAAEGNGSSHKTPEHKSDAHKPELKTSHTMAETVKEASAVLGDNQVLGGTRSQTHSLATIGATSTTAATGTPFVFTPFGSNTPSKFDFTNVFGGNASSAAPSFATGRDEKTEDGGHGEFSESTFTATPVVHVEKIEVVTGQEGESTVFKIPRIKLYELTKPPSQAAGENPTGVHFEGKLEPTASEDAKPQMTWEERGVGELKINEHEGKYRILMLVEKTLRVKLNSPLHSEMNPTLVDPKHVTFFGFNPSGTFARFMIRVKNPQEGEGLFAALSKYSGAKHE